MSISNTPRPVQARVAARLAGEYIERAIAELKYIRDPMLEGVVANLRQGLTTARGHVDTLAVYVGVPEAASETRAA